MKARGQRNHVWVEVSGSGLPIRIIKNWGEASKLPSDLVRFVDRTWAVGEIRRQVFERDGYECRRCGKRLTLQSGHMDHIVSKGDRGDTSVENGQLLCFDCHEGTLTSEHGNRRLLFTRRG